MLFRIISKKICSQFVLISNQTQLKIVIKSIYRYERSIVSP